MSRIDLDNPKFVLVIAGLFSIVLSFVILRVLLLNTGIVESIDIQWNNYVNMFALWFHTWNFYTGGSQIIFVSQFPLYSLVLLFKDVALAQRVTYFSIISLISFNMFLVAFYSLKRIAHNTTALYLGSIVASLFYVLNPLVFTEIFHISFLWSYSLFPLVFYFTWQALNSVSRRKVIVSSLLLGVFFAFMADAWGMAIGACLFVILALSTIVLNFRKNLTRRFFSNLLLTVLIMGLAALLLASYWLLPYVLQRASEPVWDPFSVANLVTNSQYNSFSRIFGLHSWISQPFFSSYGANESFYNVWQYATLFLPIVAVSAILLRRNKLTLTLSGLLIVGFFLATGVKYAGIGGTGVWPPFGDFYLWLTFYSPKIISVQTFLLKYPHFFLAIVSLAVALLSAVLVSEVFGRTKFRSFSLKRFSAKSHGLPIVLFLSIISLIALVGSPLLTGNLNGGLNPVTLPTQYTELNKFLADQNGTFRVMWLPEEASFTWSENSFANKIEYWGSAAPPLMYGWGISASPNAGFLGNMIYDYLSINQTLQPLPTHYIGKLLALENVKYVVLHADNNDSAINSTSQIIYENLKSQADLMLKDLGSNLSNNSDGNLFVFENSEMMNYFQALSKVNLVVGGLDSIGSLSDINDIYLNESAFLFVENQQMSDANLASILNSKDLSKTMLFYDNKNFDDLVLDTIDAGSLIAPSEIFVNTSTSGWLKDTVTSYYWTPVVLGSYGDEKYDFGLGHNLLYNDTVSTNSNEVSFKIPIEIKETGEYSPWIRILYSPNGGNLTVSIDGHPLRLVDSDNSTINTMLPVLTGFKWVQLENMTLNTGSHTLTFNSNNGLNAVNLIALPTVNELKEHAQNLIDLINQSNATVVYFIDKPFLNLYQSGAVNFTFYAPQESSYVINFAGNPQSVTVDGFPRNVAITNSFSEGQAWNSTGSIDLPQGNHIIEFNGTFVDKTIIYSSNKTIDSLESLKDIFGGGAEPYVVSYEKTGAVSFSVFVNASKPFILAFNEPADEFWQINASATKLVLSSVNNGFLMNGTDYSWVTLNVYYAPEASLQLGEKISVISFVSVLALISVLLVLPKIKEKRHLTRPVSQISAKKNESGSAE